MKSLFLSSVWRSNAITDFYDLRVRLRNVAVGAGWNAWLDVIDAPDLDVRSDSRRVRNACLEEVSRHDMYIGVFADRYGQARFGSTQGFSDSIGLALTELELHQAIRSGCAVRLYVLDLRAGSAREKEVEAMLSSLCDDGLLGQNNLKRVAPDRLEVHFQRDIADLRWKTRFAVPSDGTARSLARRCRRLGPFLDDVIVLEDAPSTGFDRELIEGELLEMGRNYSRREYAQVFDASLRCISMLRRVPPARNRQHLDLWMRVTELWNKSANWLSVSGASALGDLSAGLFLRRLLFLSGRDEDLVNRYLWDGGVATCLRNLALSAEGRFLRKELLSHALARTERALIHANDPALHDRRAGLEDIRATVLIHVGRRKDAVAAASRAMNNRGHDINGQEESFAFSNGIYGWCSGERSRIEEALRVCLEYGHPGFAAQLALWLAVTLLKGGKTEEAVRRFAEAQALERTFLRVARSASYVPKSLRALVLNESLGIVCGRSDSRLHFSAA